MEINGVEYELRPQYQSQRKSSRNLLRIAAISDMFAMPGMRSKKEKPLPANIEEEFGLIQLKQSKLSRSERERVFHAFNKMYKPIIKNQWKIK